MALKAAKTPQIPQDPQLAVQQQAAERDKMLEIQKRVGTETDDLVRLFGARSAMAGGTMKAPVLGF